MDLAAVMKISTPLSKIKGKPGLLKADAAGLCRAIAWSVRITQLFTGPDKTQAMCYPFEEAVARVFAEALLWRLCC